MSLDEFADNRAVHLFEQQRPSNSGFKVKLGAVRTRAIQRAGAGEPTPPSQCDALTGLRSRLDAAHRASWFDSATAERIFDGAVEYGLDAGLGMAKASAGAGAGARERAGHHLLAAAYHGR